MLRIVTVTNGERKIIRENLEDTQEVVTSLDELGLWDWALENDPDYTVPNFEGIGTMTDLARILSEVNNSWGWYYVCVEQYVTSDPVKIVEDWY